METKTVTSKRMMQLRDRWTGLRDALVSEQSSFACSLWGPEQDAVSITRQHRLTHLRDRAKFVYLSAELEEPGEITPLIHFDGARF